MRPMSINKLSNSFENVVSSPVIPVESPVVVNALNTSKEISLSEKGSMNEMVAKDVKKNSRKVKNIRNDFSTVGVGIVFLNKTVSSRPIPIDHNLVTSTANVLVLIPPPVLLEEPPTNMRNIRTTKAPVPSVLMSMEDKPPFRAVEERKKAFMALLATVRSFKVLDHSATKKIINPNTRRLPWTSKFTFV